MGNGKYIAGIAVHAANYPMDRAYSYLIPEALYRPHYRARCARCGMRLSCNGCSDCGRCERGEDAGPE